MAGLPWIKVAVVLPGHPKLQMLEKFLGIEDGLGVLVRLWCWAATYYPDGEFPVSAVAGMERVVAGDLQVTGVTGALVSSGWIDPLGVETDRYRVHDWTDFQSAHADKAEREKEQVRERVRRFRNRKKLTPVTLPSNAPVTVTSNGVTAEREKEREREKEKKISLARPLQITGAGGRRNKVCLGPKSTLFVASCAKGLGHGLVPLGSSEEAEALEKRVDAHGGPEAAREYIAAACRRRDDFDPQSVKLLLDMLGDPLTPEVAS